MSTIQPGIKIFYTIPNQFRNQFDNVIDDAPPTLEQAIIWFNRALNIVNSRGANFPLITNIKDEESGYWYANDQYEPLPSPYFDQLMDAYFKIAYYIFEEETQTPYFQSAEQDFNIIISKILGNKNQTIDNKYLTNQVNNITMRTPNDKCGFYDFKGSRNGKKN